MIKQGDMLELDPNLIRAFEENILVKIEQEPLLKSFASVIEAGTDYLVIILVDEFDPRCKQVWKSGDFRGYKIELRTFVNY